jgi:hypothetical protein
MRFVCLIAVGLIVVAGCKSSPPSTPAKAEPTKAAVHESAPADPITVALRPDHVAPPFGVSTSTAGTTGVVGRSTGPKAITVSSTKKVPARVTSKTKSGRAVAVSSKRSLHGKAMTKRSKAASKLALAKKKKAAAAALAKKGGKGKAKVGPARSAPKAPARRSSVSGDVAAASPRRVEAMTEPRLIL